MRTLEITDRTELDKIIRACKTCYLSMCVDNKPYLLPMNFGYDGQYIILHSAQEGRLWDTIKANPNVCINWTLGDEVVYQHEHVGCSYRVKSSTVILEGAVEFVDYFDEKEQCLRQLMAQYSDREFEFSAPSVRNVGVFRVKVDKLRGRAFGMKPDVAWK